MSAQSRPSFQLLWLLFKKVDGDGSLEFVAKMIGGKVQQNLSSGAFPNACPIRMSYVLNHAGIDVGQARGRLVSGADGSRYLFRVADMQAFLSERFGAPDIVAAPPTPSRFSGSKGILVFEVHGWSNATGHVTLWDGVSLMDCSDHCYFQRASTAHLWLLP
jgi:hypothetical protein